MKNQKLEMVLLARGNRRAEMTKKLYEKLDTQKSIYKNGWKLATEKQIEAHYKIDVAKKDEIPNIELKVDKGKKDKQIKLESQISDQNHSSDTTLILESNI